MVLVTDLQYAMEPKLKHKLDLMIKRCTHPKNKKDALLLVEGGEGEGKTNLSLQAGYYVKYKTGRPFSEKNVFFSAKALTDFAQNTEEQIIVYDEPALDMLGAEWWKEEQLNLVKLLMTARKKRHFLIFNITKFYKFNEYIIVDRAIGMVHVYSRNEIEPGRFVYIKKKAIEYLYNSYRSSKRRDYKKYANFRGTFPDYVEGIINLQAYELEKDRAIMSIGTKKKNKTVIELNKLKKVIGSLKCPIKTREELAEKVGYTLRTLQKWAKTPE